MKQLYTAGPLGKGTPRRRSNSTPDQAAVAVRAASGGLRPEEIQVAVSLATYVSPSALATGDRPLPVRLALLHTPTGRILTHVSPKDGTFFAHTLVDVPPTADAQLAIQTWGSPFWQRHEPDSGAPLPELSYLPVADALDDNALKDWLAVPAQREMLEFALTA